MLADRRGALAFLYTLPMLMPAVLGAGLWLGFIGQTRISLSDAQAVFWSEVETNALITVMTTMLLLTWSAWARHSLLAAIAGKVVWWIHASATVALALVLLIQLVIPGPTFSAIAIYVGMIGGLALQLWVYWQPLEGVASSCAMSAPQQR